MLTEQSKGFPDVFQPLRLKNIGNIFDRLNRNSSKRMNVRFVYNTRSLISFELASFSQFIFANRSGLCWKKVYSQKKPLSKKVYL